MANRGGCPPARRRVTGLGPDRKFPCIGHPGFNPERGGGLTGRVNEFFEAGLQKSTVKKCKARGLEYCSFARKSRLCPLTGVVPAPPGIDLTLFAVKLAGAGKSPSVIESHLSGVAWCYEASGFTNPGRMPGGSTHPALTRVLRGIRKQLTSTRRARKPITSGLLRKMLGAMREACPLLSRSDVVAHKAALAHAMRDLLRASELVAQKVHSDNQLDCKASDIAMHDDGAGFDRVIRASKTDVFKKSVTLTSHSTGASGCPVRWMRRWLRARKAKSFEPLLKLNDGANITRDRLSRVMRCCLGAIGEEPTHYAPHSLRKGGAVSLSAAGYGKEVICKFGRWSSDAYLGCLELSTKMRAAAAKKMAAVKLGDVLKEDLKTYDNRYDL